jgi:hypothetical protein
MLIVLTVTVKTLAMRTTLELLASCYKRLVATVATSVLHTNKEIAHLRVGSVMCFQVEENG